MIAGFLDGGAFGRRVIMANKSLLENHQSLLGWEVRIYPCFKKYRDPWARLSEQSFSSRHLNRARHMDPKASSTRDQHAAGWIQGAERRLGGHRTGGSEGSIRFKCYNAGTDPIDGSV